MGFAGAMIPATADAWASTTTGRKDSRFIAFSSQQKTCAVPVPLPSRAEAELPALALPLE
jgi:hypothetical protein